MSSQRIKFIGILSAVILFIALAAFVRWFARDPGIDLSRAEISHIVTGQEKGNLPPEMEGKTARPFTGFLKQKERPEGSSRLIPRRSSAAGPPNDTPSSRARDRSGIPSLAVGERRLPRGITEDDIPPLYANDLEGFLDRIGEVAEENLSESEKEQVDPVLFTTAFPDVINGSPFYTKIFSPFSGRIYGFFNSRTENLDGRDRILVKWTGAKGEMLLYEYMTILPDTPFNYVWWEQGFWDEGTYIMVVYGLENDIQPLAYGSFQVSGLPEFIGHLKLCEDLDQGRSQTDFSFSSRIILSFDYAAQGDRTVVLVLYKMETGEYLLDEDVLLPADESGTFSRVLKEPDDTTFPFGTFAVEVWTEQEYPEGRVVFVYHE